MNIEHSRFLSWFSDDHGSHEQDGERLLRTGDPRVATASGDPAMAFGPFVGCRALSKTRNTFGSPMLPD
jgi:hypothetical protein